MATSNGDVWSAMNYTPPRGKCNLKTSLMAPACACLRFMLHPIKARTSFECDGCGHHASFHEMSNPAEEAILEKWNAQGQNSVGNTQTTAPPRKRQRLLTHRQEDTAGGT